MQPLVGYSASFTQTAGPLRQYVKMAFQAQQQRGETHRTGFATLKDAYHGDTIGAVSVGGIDLFHKIFKPLLFPTIALPAPVHPGGAEEEQCLEEAYGCWRNKTIWRINRRAPSPRRCGYENARKDISIRSSKKHKRRAYSSSLMRSPLDLDAPARCLPRNNSTSNPTFCVSQRDFGGYLPLAATLTTEAIYDAFLGLPEEGKQFFHGHTYTGNPLACAVSLASLDLFRTENVLAHVAQLTTVFSTALAALERTPWIRHTRQCGVMIGIDLCAPDGSDAPPQTGHKVSMIARSLGAVFRPLGNTIVLNPPLSLTTTEAERLIEITREASRHVLEDLT